MGNSNWFAAVVFGTFNHKNKNSVNCISGILGDHSLNFLSYYS